MDLHRFSYGTFTEIEVGIAEVVVDEGADIDMAMVEELHQAFLAQLPERFSLLINKKNAYSTQLDALIKFGQLPAIDKIAVYAPNKLAKMSADFSASIPSSQALNILVFIDKDDALSWLRL